MTLFLLVGLFVLPCREDPDVVLIGEMRDLETIAKCYNYCRDWTLSFCHPTHQLCQPKCRQDD
jgi:hypothetical protein